MDIFSLFNIEFWSASDIVVHNMRHSVGHIKRICRLIAILLFLLVTILQCQCLSTQMAKEKFKQRNIWLKIKIKSVHGENRPGVGCV